jgi:sigma54-dependent transcription regulator
LDKFGVRFARVRYWTFQIRTLDMQKEAIDSSFDKEMEKLAATA